ncbi:MAG: N-acetylmuramidase domain-containing protein [Lentilitoribacter sp.]
MTSLIGVNVARLRVADYDAIASQYNVERAILQAFAKVEAAGSGFWQNGRIKLLYEGHIAYRHTSGAERDKLVRAGLAWKSWGDVKYGKSSVSVARLKKAVKLIGPKAFMFASYGLGQVLGVNAESLGYGNAKAMVHDFLQGERNQLGGMMRFLKVNNLLVPLRNKLWAAVARGYNGKSYAKHNYHGRLADAYNFFASKVAIPAPWADGLLKKGDRGKAVKSLQSILNKYGAELEVDGHFGKATYRAVIDVSIELGLDENGIVDRAKFAALKASANDDEIIVQDKPVIVTEMPDDVEERIAEKTKWWRRGLGGLFPSGMLGSFFYGLDGQQILIIGVAILIALVVGLLFWRQIIAAIKGVRKEIAA